jgi:acyl-CoA-binding protein
MADLSKQFETAQADVKKLSKRPDNEDMLRLRPVPTFCGRSRVTI